jgi:hypothetical protein
MSGRADTVHLCSPSMVVPKVHAASDAFMFGMEETRLKVARTSAS